jgi:hypothetical protein
MTLRPPHPPHRRNSFHSALIAGGCLALGLLVGVLLGVLLGGPSGPAPAPTADELRELCAVEPGVRVRPWLYIVLHHSAGGVGDAELFDAVHREERGWVHGLGYDFVIGNGSRSRDGEIQTGRRWRRQLDGAHCQAAGMNRKAIGICFVGNFETGPGPTRAQVRAGRALVRHLARRFEIPPECVLGHGDVRGAHTACPGRHFPLDRFCSAAEN